MKKSFFTIILFTFVTVLSVFAGDAKFTRDYETAGIGFRVYETSDYLNGNYRSNFTSITQNRMLNYMKGFKYKVGVFELEGTTLYVGRSDDGNGYLQLCDENGKMWIGGDSYKEREESYFKYTNFVPGGLVTQIELKGKKYTVAVAAVSSSLVGVYSDSEGFRMWVETEAPKDSAASKTIEKTLCYEAVDIREGLYKPGYTRLWGQVVEMPENAGFIYKYSYKGFDFLFNGNTNDGSEWLRNTDGTKLPADFVSAFYMYKTLSGGKISERGGLGIEADVQLGDNKVRLAFSQYDGDKRVWVKDTSGYPVIQNEKSSKANPKTKAKKTEKTKKSGKAANFTRDYENWTRVYSKGDIEKGLYKTNYINIPQKRTDEITVSYTYKGENKKVTLINGIFELDNCEIGINYFSELGWDITPFTVANRAENWKLNRTIKFSVGNENYPGIEAEVLRNGKVISYIAIVAMDIEKGDYKLFTRTRIDEETAMNDTDAFGLEYFDFIDLESGVYKPGFEYVKGFWHDEEESKQFFKDTANDNPTYDYLINGELFLIGPAQDPVDYVKRLDGSVIFNPEKQIRFMTGDTEGNYYCHTGMSYGWEGKVNLGGKDVTLAFIKWEHAVSVFVKE